MTHRGQGKYFDTEFRANDGERKVVPGYYTNVVTDMAVEWLEERKKARQPFLLMLGHKAPHSFYFPGGEVCARLRRGADPVSRDRLPARRQAGLDQAAAQHLARDLRAALRLAQGVSRHLGGGHARLREHDAGLLGHDPVGG